MAAYIVYIVHQVDMLGIVDAPSVELVNTSTPAYM
jgi:hypothetical protein